MAQFAIQPGVTATGKLTNQAGSVKRNLASDTNDGFANIWHYFDQSAANSGDTLVPGDNIGAGTLNCRGVLAAASASGKPLRIPPGTYKVDSNVTIAQTVYFANGAILKPANGITITLSAGYIAEDSQQVFDISLGGVIAVDKRDYFSVMHWGAKNDYVYSNTGTDNSSQIQACMDAAQVMASIGTGKKPTVVIPPGEYRLLSYISIPHLIDFDMTGAVLQYRGATRTGGVVTIGENGDPLTRKYKGLNITGWYAPTNPNVTEQDTFACLKIVSMYGSVVEVDRLSGASIGMLLAPKKLKNISHCKFYGGNIDTVKYSIDLRGNFSVGYVNENDFFSWNLSHSSSADTLGGVYGVRFSVERRELVPDYTTDTFTSVGHGLSNGDYGNIYAESSLYEVPAGMATTTTYYVVNATADTFQLSTTNGGAAFNFTSNGTGKIYMNGYTGQNSNRFYGTCFQVGTHSSTYELSVSKAVTTGVRYVNLSTLTEYYCAAGGTVATVPTHTSGTVVDGNGVSFTHVGAYRKCPVWFDKAGSASIFYGCRWETGYGGFCRVTQPPSLTCRLSGNEMQVYGMDGNALAYPVVDHFGDLKTNVFQFQTKVSFYGQDDVPSTALKGIQYRAIGSGSNLCVKGMCFKAGNSSTMTQYRSGTYILCKDSLYQASGYLLAVLAKFNEYSGMKVGYDNAGVYIGRIFISFLDKKYNVLAIPTTSSIDVGITSIDTLSTANNNWYTTNDYLTSIYLRKNTSSSAEHASIGFSTNGIEISNVYVSPVVEGQKGLSGQAPIRLFTPWEPDSNYGNRFAYGTPTVGYFLTPGEYIQNINVATSQPLGWIVKAPGGLAPAWATGVAVRKGELRGADASIYAALSAGTTGATEPADTDDVSDGNITWEYICPEATLIATTQVY